MKDANLDLTTNLLGFEFSIHQTNFVPAYAVPEASTDSSSSTNNVLICCPGQEPKWYYLKNSSGKWTKDRIILKSFLTHTYKS